jgi:hypothetical protein
MAELTWDAPGDRLFYTGVDRGVFYPQNSPGVPWNGLTSVKESTEGADQTYIYVDGRTVINKLGLGNFAATVEAITYPEALMPYDGYSESMYSAQSRATFNFSYRTILGNGADGVDHGYILHLVYNCMLKPTNRDYDTLTASSDLMDFSWDLSTVPVPIPDGRPSAHFFLNSTLVQPGILQALESYLYGTEIADPLFPAIDQLMGLFEENALYLVVDNGDGTWTASGPDEAFDINGDVFALDWPWVEWLDTDTYRIKSF